MTIRQISVQDLMIPLKEYGTIGEDATLYEGVLALLENHKEQKAGRDAHRAILVVNSDGHVVGKLSHMDVMRALEPGYGRIATPASAPARLGFSQRFLKLLADDYRLWDKPLDQICRKAAEIKVRDIMYAPSTEGEYVHEKATLDEAINQLIMGEHRSLLVIRSGRVTGILRLTDVFAELAERIRACPM